MSVNTYMHCYFIHVNENVLKEKKTHRIVQKFLTTIIIKQLGRQILITLAWSRIAALHADIDVDVITDA